MARYQLTTQPPVSFDDLKAGQVALMLSAGSEPPVRLLDTIDLRREWVVAQGIVFPKGALLTHITAQQGEVGAEEDLFRVEVRPRDHIDAKPMQVSISASQLKPTAKNSPEL